MEREPLDSAGPGQQRRAFSVLRGTVETEGVRDEREALAALFRIDRSLERDLTHGFHSYAGRMHPSIARGALDRWSAKGESVLDPFCGGGTVLVEAMVAARVAAGVDASPLAGLIAEVRTSPLDEAGRSRLVGLARTIAEASEARARGRVPVTIPAWARQETMRFSPHTALELFGLRELVKATPEDTVGRALWLCLSSILVKFMRAGKQAAPGAAEKRIGRGIPSRHFAARVEELARGLELLEQQVPAGTPNAQVLVGDACHLPLARQSRFDLVLTSPPYAGVYDYAEHHDVRFAWLELERASFDQTQIGARGKAPGAALRPWVDARRRWLAEMSRVLRPGGHAVLVIGDGIVGSKPENASWAIARAAPAAGLEPIARASQLRPPLDPRLAALFGDQPRWEHLLLLRRR